MTNRNFVLSEFAPTFSPSFPNSESQNLKHVKTRESTKMMTVCDLFIYILGVTLLLMRALCSFIFSAIEKHELFDLNEKLKWIPWLLWAAVLRYIGPRLLWWVGRRGVFWRCICWPGLVRTSLWLFSRSLCCWAWQEPCEWMAAICTRSFCLW